MRAFIDTNVLLYSISIHPDEQAKQQRAARLLKRENCVFSVQVLQEFYVQATRPSRQRPASHDEACGLIDAWMRYPVQDLTADVLRHALQLKKRFGFSYWDCAIIAAAHISDCGVLYSEDLQHEQLIGGLKIIDPFRGG